MDNEPKFNGGKRAAETHRDVCPGKHDKLEVAEVREKLSAAKGPQYWRSLEELAATPQFAEMLHREFPRQASEWDGGGTSRRDFLKIMSASMALAGLSACTRQPLEPIVPYVRQPEGIVLGKPQFFATAMPFGSYAIPVLVESHEGRPTKIEGNPQHPGTFGGSDIFSQSSILTMYDPDRSQAITYLGDARPWGQFLNAFRGPLNGQKAASGAGLRILTGAINSPTLAGQMRDFLKTYPQAKWHVWEPVSRDNVRAAAMASFGQPVETQFNFEKAEVVLALDGDFLSSGYPGFHRYARQFASRRNPGLKEEMLRFYAVESTPTNSGGKADHRLPVRASEVETIARVIASQLGVANAGNAQLKPEHQKFVAAAVKDLQAKHGRAVVVAGDHQPIAVHMLAHAMNQSLGAVGQTVAYTDAVEMNPVDKSESLRELAADMQAGKVDLLIIFGANPVYDAPVDIDFKTAMQKVPLRVYHGLYADETSNQCHWVVNGLHYLEMWGDARSFDGTVSIIQPLIAPLYNGKSEHEMFAVLTNQPDATGYDLVRKYWQSQGSVAKTSDFEAWWRKTLHDGFMPDTAMPTRTLTPKSGVIPQPAAVDTSAMEVMFRRDPTIYDGRFSNNAWLQETPKPMTQITWDNPVLISMKTAAKLGLKSEDVVELEVRGHKVKGAVWLQPGHPDDSVTVFLGYGRERAGRVGSGTGFNGYRIRSSDSPWFAAGLKLTKTGESYGFACTQGFQNMDGRALVRAATLEDFIKNPGFAHEMVEAPAPGLTLYQAYEYKEHKWGMTIDQNSCIGCKTCVVACQSENNIPVVGKAEVKRGRHMHWLRVDTYHEGTPENPKSFFQPLPCMQCENAPCEVVCPVGATVHSTEGLNDMVYNRCVGTRYCSNNCPYKVRRFNFLLYQDWNTEQLKMMRNPDVTVRSRGVMEKCTYCVQRITHARIRAEEEDRRVADGEVLTACQQACPAGAIIFGDMNDPNSRVAKLKATERNYGLLEDLNTRPRTTYLAAVRNTNNELEPAEHNDEHASKSEATGKGA